MAVPLGLTLSREQTRITHIDEGIDFLGGQPVTPSSSVQAAWKQEEEEAAAVPTVTVDQD